jgi:hypothetical protein
MLRSSLAARAHVRPSPGAVRYTRLLAQARVSVLAERAARSPDSLLFMVSSQLLISLQVHALHFLGFQLYTRETSSRGSVSFLPLPTVLLHTQVGPPTQSRCERPPVAAAPRPDTLRASDRSAAAAPTCCAGAG